MFEHLDKSLPDDAGGTENSYRKFGRHIFLNRVRVDFIPAKFSAGNAVAGTKGRYQELALRYQEEQFMPQRVFSETWDLTPNTC
jgi:hypothetical protein